MSSLRVYLRSLLSSWVGYGANIVVMFFLSPFVFHSLGKSSYGVWSLLMTVSGYLGLAEIGVRVSTGRYINYYQGRGKQKQVDRVVSTSLVFYSLIGLLVTIVSGSLGMAFGTLFQKTPPELVQDAKWVLFLMGVNVWLGFLASVYAQLLDSRNRFDLRALVMLLALGIRCLGTVYVLKQGGGLTSLAWVLVVSSFVSLVAFRILGRAKGAEAHFAWINVRWQTFTQVFRYGGWAFVQNIGVRIIAYTDAVIIALLLGMEEVAIYSVAGMLLRYVTEFIAHVFRVISPDLAKVAGRNDQASLHLYILRTTRVTLLLVVPLYVGLMVLGGDFIRLWMGKGLEECRWVLLILAGAHISGMLRWGVTLGVKTVGYVRVTALIGLAEAISNLVLSLLLVELGWGIYGVAAGVTIPSVLIGMTTTLYYGQKTIGFSTLKFAREILAPALLAGALFAAACLMIRSVVIFETWKSLGWAIGLLALIYVPVGWWVLVPSITRQQITQRLGVAMNLKQQVET